MSRSTYIEGEHIKKIHDFCASRAEIILACLFGSQATGKAGPLSDTDLAFLIDASMIDNRDHPYGYQAHLTTELIRILSTNDVDVIILNQAPILLKFSVVHQGRLIYCRSRKQWLDFYLKIFNEYQDFRPMIAVQNKYLIERMKKTQKSAGGVNSW
ncbi:MAG: type VII toxin-antitoxin system MntA family adenylyltransferase antitoxin [Bacillota bacterium]